MTRAASRREIERSCPPPHPRVHSRVPPTDRMSDGSPSSASTLLERAALVTLQLGAIAVVLAAAVYKQFELDRFFVPKELVLHVLDTLSALCCRARGRAVRLA